MALPVGGGLGARRERIRPERRQRGIKYPSQPPGLHARIVKCCRQVSLLMRSLLLLPKLVLWKRTQLLLHTRYTLAHSRHAFLSTALNVRT